MGIDFTQHFPEELSLRVMFYLSAKELGLLACVSQEWCRLSKDDHLWLRHLQEIMSADQRRVPPGVKILYQIVRGVGSFSKDMEIVAEALSFCVSSSDEAVRNQGKLMVFRGIQSVGTHSQREREIVKRALTKCLMSEETAQRKIDHKLLVNSPAAAVETMLGEIIREYILLNQEANNLAIVYQRISNTFFSDNLNGEVIIKRCIAIGAQQVEAFFMDYTQWLVKSTLYELRKVTDIIQYCAYFFKPKSVLQMIDQFIQSEQDRAKMIGMHAVIDCLALPRNIGTLACDLVVEYLSFENKVMRDIGVQIVEESIRRCSQRKIPGYCRGTFDIAEILGRCLCLPAEKEDARNFAQKQFRLLSRSIYVELRKITANVIFYLADSGEPKYIAMAKIMFGELLQAEEKQSCMTGMEATIFCFNSRPYRHEFLTEVITEYILSENQKMQDIIIEVIKRIANNADRYASQSATEYLGRIIAVENNSVRGFVKRCFMELHGSENKCGQKIAVCAINLFIDLECEQAMTLVMQRVEWLLNSENNIMRTWGRTAVISYCLSNLNEKAKDEIVINLIKQCVNSIYAEQRGAAVELIMEHLTSKRFGNGETANTNWVVKLCEELNNESATDVLYLLILKLASSPSHISRPLLHPSKVREYKGFVRELAKMTLKYYILSEKINIKSIAILIIKSKTEAVTERVLPILREVLCWCVNTHSSVFSGLLGGVSSNQDVKINLSEPNAMLAVDLFMYIVRHKDAVKSKSVFSGLFDNSGTSRQKTAIKVLNVVLRGEFNPSLLNQRDFGNGELKMIATNYKSGSSSDTTAPIYK
ncbi:MAG: F-box protein [Gammaproteobacteria bacterium]|nr:F-box protein [Gammaproteobacteria bacterium]